LQHEHWPILAMETLWKNHAQASPISSWAV